MSNKLRIAVTGGIGGGKSTFCNYMIKKGYPVLSADELAKEILVRDKEVKEKIIKIFGKESYRNGRLNNAYLADKVFSDPKAVKKINSIVHPKVITEIEVLADKALKKNKAVFVEAALIFEAGMEEMFDYIVLVTADEEIKKKRVVEKGIPEKEYEKRQANQIPDEKKKKKADFVFENNSTTEDLYAKAELFLKII